MKKYLFLASVFVLYAITLLFDPTLAKEAVKQFLSIFLKVLPVLAMVFLLMTFTGVFFNAKKLTQNSKKDSVKTWLIAIIGGIISSGPIYMWYPFLADLHSKGLSHGFLACFMYNRAIKLPLLPMMVGYFGLLYTITLTFVMVIMSLIQGITMNIIMEE